MVPTLVVSASVVTGGVSVCCDLVEVRSVVALDAGI